MPTALIIGASRGIGLEFTRQYRGAGWRVLATVRSDGARERVQALGAEALTVDVTKPESLRALATSLAYEQLNVAVYVAGIMSRGNARTPPAGADFDALMHTNVLGAMQVLPQVAPRVAAANGVFAVLSSGMSLIASVQASDCWLYRVSKAALNMAVASARNDYPGATLVVLDPGWVRTDMGGASAAITPQESVHDLRALLAKVTPADNGAFLHRDGRRERHW
jgi:NAD(P)-dependent dehydrogenase (short-subunit alcohol dehydrogenase family)